MCIRDSAEGVARHGVGARVDLSAVASEAGLDGAAVLFSESAARVLVAVRPEHREAFDALVAEHGVPAVTLGTTTSGDALRVVTGAGEVTLTASEISQARGRTFAELTAGGGQEIAEAEVAEAHGH